MRPSITVRMVTFSGLCLGNLSPIRRSADNATGRPGLMADLVPTVSPLRVSTRPPKGGGADLRDL